MNAYELADKLETDAWDEATIVQSIHLGIKMLRQQADRIADYEKWEKRWSERVARAENRIAELEKDLAKYDELAIDDLEGKRIIWCACGDAITPDSGAVCGVCASFRSTKEQNAEPVAWIRSGDDQLSLVKGEDDGYMVWKPLYTSPHSDNLGLAESIIKQQEIRIAELEKQLNTPKTYVFDGKQVWDTTPQIKELSDEEWISVYTTWALTNNDPLVLKRAILKKASEK